jgi:hypothetical protein
MDNQLLDRIAEERDHLSIKLRNLNNFIFREVAFDSLPPIQQNLLHQQYILMDNYRTILDLRYTLIAKSLAEGEGNENN